VPIPILDDVVLAEILAGALGRPVGGPIPRMNPSIPSLQAEATLPIAMPEDCNRIRAIEQQDRRKGPGRVFDAYDKRKGGTFESSSTLCDLRVAMLSAKAWRWSARSLRNREISWSE
jgi:hypothetical protein